MARIHENTLKWLNEQLKKKHIKNKNNNVVVEEDLKQCIYCHKLFLNASFVVKHIFKRHAEQFLLLQKKFANTTKTDVDLDPQSVLVNYLKREFYALKTELETVKKAVTHHPQVNDHIKHQVTYPPGYQDSTASGEVSNINALEDKCLPNTPESISENISRDDFIQLQAKVDEMSQLYKEIVSSSKGKAVLQEDRICKRLKNELFTDFENLLIRYQDQNSEWKEHFLQLRSGVQRLEHAVEQNTKKIESPDVLKEIENKIEQQIESFYANYGIFDGSNKTPFTTSRKVLNDNSLNVHRSNRRKKSIYTSSSPGLNLQKKQLDTSMKTDNPLIETDLPETYNAHTSFISKADSKNIQKLGAEQAKLIFEEKLKGLSISPKAKQLSTEEYKTKMHLLEAQKELLCQKYTNFQQIYERLDSQANKLVKAQVERKLSKQVRFSDSIPGQASQLKNKVNNEQITDKSSLTVEKMNSSFMHDFGDFSDIQNEHSFKYVRNLNQGDFALDVASKKTEGFNFQEHFAVSPQNLSPSNAFSELKLIDNPNQSLCPKSSNDFLKSVDEFSELSSLESDTNLSQCEFEKL